MSLAEQALPYVRAISPYLPGKPITELAREMGIPVDNILKLASNAILTSSTSSPRWPDAAAWRRGKWFSATARTTCLT